MTHRKITRRDVALGRVAPKTIENGAVSPPAAQINALTLEEAQARLAYLHMRPLSREEAAAMGYEPDEIEACFGPA